METVGLFRRTAAKSSIESLKVEIELNPGKMGGCGLVRWVGVVKRAGSDSGNDYNIVCVVGGKFLYYDG